MSRQLRDEGLRDWEVFATTGRFGLPRPARVVFRCASDPTVRSRWVEIDGDKSDAERAVAAASAAELLRLFGEATELD